MLLSPLEGNQKNHNVSYWNKITEMSSNTVIETKEQTDDTTLKVPETISTHLKEYRRNKNT